jgi:hypothetical protein
MKNSTLSTLTMLLVSCVIMLTSCSKTVSDIDDPSASYGGNSSLNIITRSGNEDATVSYPVQVYLFNSNNACIAVQTLADADDDLSIEDLKAGTYHVYAVGAAEENRYTLPTQDAAAATSTITLQENKVHEDLMLANNTVTIGQNETNQLTLAMQRVVCMLKTIEVKQVPTDVDAVSITVTPLRETVQLNGELGGNEGSITVALTEQSDGTTWKNNTEQYMLPSVGNATITIRMTKGETTNSYSYTCTEAFAANYKINIDATFTGATFNLTGTITGATWAGERTITFEFDETNSTNSSNNDPGNNDPGNNDPGNNNNDALDGPAPTVGSNYNGTYVLRAVDNGDNTTTVTLMSPTQTTGLSFTANDQESISTAVSEAIAGLAVAGISGWRLPTKDELKYINDNFNAVNSGLTALESAGFVRISFSAHYFGINSNNQYVEYSLSSNPTEFTPDENSVVRAFTTLTFKN